MRLLVVTAVVLSAATASVAQGDGNREVKITNATSEDMIGIYASPINVNSWEENMLHGGSVSPGNSVNANVDDGTRACSYDLKAIFADGQSITKANVNVCTGVSWTISGQ